MRGPAGMPHAAVARQRLTAVGHIIQRAQAAARIKKIIGLVNDKLDPVRLDFEKDVTALTPAGNATERHLCQAYREKAEALFTRRETLADLCKCDL